MYLRLPHDDRWEWRALVAATVTVLGTSALPLSFHIDVVVAALGVLAVVICVATEFRPGRGSLWRMVVLLGLVVVVPAAGVILRINAVDKELRIDDAVSRIEAYARRTGSYPARLEEVYGADLPSETSPCGLRYEADVTPNDWLLTGVCDLAFPLSYPKRRAHAGQSRSVGTIQKPNSHERQ